jgi:hypothetical protein
MGCSESARRIRFAALLLPMLATAASPTDAPRSVPVLVTNTTCTPGPCEAVRILAFPWSEFHTPGGMWKIDLGTITTPTACVTIPATAEFRITEQPSGKTTILPWTTRDSVALGTRRPGVEIFSATPSTEWFVPQRARAWSVALPGDSTDTAGVRVHAVRRRVTCAKHADSACSGFCNA